ncbi:MAG: hypothetical protein LBH12_02165 [Dysgonamonadaceae bacterium]|jgi:hypothetical protein|nr:hypothetical protein [Dysgonamonadaceae bacterium]
MKKITLFLFCMLFAGMAELRAQLPQEGTTEDGPYYYIQVDGKAGDPRAGLVFTAETDAETKQVRVFGRAKGDIKTLDDIDRRLWSFEKGGTMTDGDGNVWDTYFITNKSTQTGLDIWHWNDTAKSREKDIAVVSDFPETQWRIFPVTNGGENPAFHIEASNPITANSPYLHQGNNGWGFGLILETAGWGASAEKESWFRFVEFEDLPNLTVSKKEIDYAYTLEGRGSEDSERPDIAGQKITVFAKAPADTPITLSLDNDDNFLISPDGLTGMGGEVEIFAFPGAPGEYTGNLTVSVTINGETYTEKVALKGLSVPKIPVKTSPTIANSENDTWYYLQYPRVGVYMKDKGTGNILETSDRYGADKDDPAQLWKFVAVNDTAFTLVSKLGNQLDYKVETVTTNPGPDQTIKETNLVYSAATSDKTFSFKVRNNDGYYILQLNEYLNTETEETTIIYVNKTNPATNTEPYIGNGYTLYSGKGDIGNVIVFSEYGKGDYMAASTLEASTAGEPIWYYMQFYRTALDGNLTNITKKFKSAGTGGEVTQTPFDMAEQKSFLWRFEEVTIEVPGEGGEDPTTETKYKIFDYNGNAIAGALSDENHCELVEVTPETPAGEFALAPYVDGDNETADFTLQMGSNYLNDFGKTHVGGYSVLDNGCRLFVIKVETVISSIENIPFEEIDDPVVSRVYYTIQGIQLGKRPTTAGLYIEKSIHASKKVTAKTIYIVE